MFVCDPDIALRPVFLNFLFGCATTVGPGVFHVRLKPALRDEWSAYSNERKLPVYYEQEMCEASIQLIQSTVKNIISFL